MSSIYTRMGDFGYTKTLDGIEVRKNELRVEVYGTVDEAGSALGLAKSLSVLPQLIEITHSIQERLIYLSAELALAGEPTKSLAQPITEKDIDSLENSIDRITAMMPPKKSFSIAGATPASAAFDLARTIIRRAERLCVSMEERSGLNVNIIKFLNRLSDLAYVMARLEEHESLVKRVVKEVLRNMTAAIDNSLLEMAKSLSQAAEEEAIKLAVPMVISIVDPAGNIVLCHRMDNSLLASIDISINKAYTAAALKMPTHKLSQLCSPGQVLYGLQNTNNGRIVIFGGGFPIWENGVIIGGIGVSGGSVEEDMKVAEGALKRVFNK